MHKCIGRPTDADLVEECDRGHTDSMMELWKCENIQLRTAAVVRRQLIWRLGHATRPDDLILNNFE